MRLGAGLLRFHPIICNFARIGCAVAVLWCAPVAAGPPFRTDDPEPVEYQHWEFYTFTVGTHVSGDTSGVLPAFEFNYGALPNVQLHVIAPVAFDAPTGGPTQFGYGDTELGVKWRFVDEDKNGWMPQIGTFPILVVPTGNAERGLGTGSTRLFLPLWLQKSFGEWTTYGGGGYWINNQRPDDKNFWFFGWLLQRKITDKLTLGGEIFHDTADSIGGFDTTAFNIGGYYDFDQHNHLLFSAGRAFQNAAQTNLYSFYLGYQITY
jgi:hypothetical protein